MKKNILLFLALIILFPSISIAQNLIGAAAGAAAGIPGPGYEPITRIQPAPYEGTNPPFDQWPYNLDPSPYDPNTGQYIPDYSKSKIDNLFPPGVLEPLPDMTEPATSTATTTPPGITKPIPPVDEKLPPKKPIIDKPGVPEPVPPPEKPKEPEKPKNPFPPKKDITKGETTRSTPRGKLSPPPTGAAIPGSITPSQSAKSLAAAADKALADKKSLIQSSPKGRGCSSTVCSMMNMAGFGKGDIPGTEQLAPNLKADSRLTLVSSNKGKVGTSLKSGDVVVTASQTFKYKNSSGKTVTNRVIGHTGIVDSKGNIINNSSTTGVPKSTTSWNSFASRRAPGGGPYLTTYVFRAVK